jgi:hypothetical protein
MAGVTPFAPVPLIGESFKVVTGFSTAVIQCQCAAKTVLVLQGKDVVKQCPHCQRGYAIAKAGGLEVGEVVLPTHGEPT